MTSDVTVVIPVWNRADLLSRLLDSLSNQTLAPLEVVVIDDASTDDAPDVAARWGARVIRQTFRLGFAASVNRGITEARTDWIAVLNSDIELAPDWLAKLVESADTRDAWFASGQIRMTNDRERLDGAWDLIARSGCAWRAGHGSRITADFERPREISLVSATATLYKKALFKIAGDFSEVYESYMEDVDLSLRVAAMGMRGIYVPDAVCWHEGSGSAGKWSYYSTRQIARNQAVLIKRLYSRDLIKSWRIHIRIGQWLWALLALRNGCYRAWLHGRREGIRLNASSILPEELSSRLRDVIVASEKEIQVLTRRNGDWYWKLYFMLSPDDSR